MKKLLQVLLMTVLSVTLVACSSNSNNSDNSGTSKQEPAYQTKTFVREQTGLKSELTYTYDGDKVLKQTAKNVIEYKGLGLSKADVEAKTAPTVAKYKGIEGITHNIEYGETQTVETLEVDYSKLDIEKAKNVPGITIEGNSSNISMAKSEELLKKEGYKEK